MLLLATKPRLNKDTCWVECTVVSPSDYFTTITFSQGRRSITRHLCLGCRVPTCSRSLPLHFRPHVFRPASSALPFSTLTSQTWCKHVPRGPRSPAVVLTVDPLFYRFNCKPKVGYVFFIYRGLSVSCGWSEYVNSVGVRCRRSSI